ncbi:DNA-binding domain-containing protein [Histidinibacterium lentulum]|uniref:DUF2063 domain-containing protein n=1 Tax=Histidinibacterium lentulum TaxID=2480588 RepID=A0A3N2QU31_9RHOB|nr:DNA-binding domain-containing protein [Histidinibacterium lentulum]ROT98555.1 DUF2063 domain-containing protein [Histidinibacterium lentulum]
MRSPSSSGQKYSLSAQPQPSLRQPEFVAALLAPETAVPPGLTGPDGSPAGKRFDIYRNNVAVSLTEALETGFPVLRKLVGEAFFAALAGVFLRRHLPSSPILARYGQEMPAFLAEFPPVAHLPYLPDVARLELALRAAYHAGDASPLDPAALGALAPEALDRALLIFSPAVQLVRSIHPVHAIWAANSDPAAPRPRPGAQAALVTRPGFDPLADPLGPNDGELVAGLMEGKPLGLAAEAGGDLARVLSLLLSRNAITELCT